jgi:hypothetical protein
VPACWVPVAAMRRKHTVAFEKEEEEDATVSASIRIQIRILSRARSRKRTSSGIMMGEYASLMCAIDRSIQHAKGQG